MRGSIELIHLPARPAAVTRGLDPRKSDVSDLRPFKVPELGNTRVLVVHLLRIKVFLRKGWIAPKSDVSDFGYLKRAEVGNTRLRCQARQ
jgi:hypothetical protein